jgi:hypothetical protein
MTQSLRALLAGQGVTVHGVFTGPVDTDMTGSFEIPKASPEYGPVRRDMEHDSDGARFCKCNG